MKKRQVHRTYSSEIIAERAEQRRLAPGASVVLKTVAEFWNVSVDEILGDARPMRVTHPRKVVMWLLNVHCGHSSAEIGRLMRRDHTTILSGARSIEGLRKTDARLDEQLEHLGRVLGLASVMRMQSGAARSAVKR